MINPTVRVPDKFKDHPTIRGLLQPQPWSQANWHVVVAEVVHMLEILEKQDAELKQLRPFSGRLFDEISGLRKRLDMLENKPSWDPRQRGWDGQ